MDGALTQVECVDEDIILGDRRGELEVRVGDSAGGVVPRDKGRLDVWWERRAPQDWGVHVQRNIQSSGWWGSGRKRGRRGGASENRAGGSSRVRGRGGGVPKNRAGGSRR